MNRHGLAESQENSLKIEIEGMCSICKKNAGTVQSPGGNQYCAECDRCNRCGGSVVHFVRYEDYQAFMCPCVVKMNKLIKQEDEKRKIAKMRKRETLLSGGRWHNGRRNIRSSSRL